MSNFESQLPTGNYEGEVISQELSVSTGGHATFEIKFGNLVHATSGPVDPETRRTVRLYLSNLVLIKIFLKSQLPNAGPCY
jgi:hypothetical protein